MLTGVAHAAREWAFQAAFARTFAMNILFEDSEVDNRFLELDERSDVLAITGAGCGVAGLLAKRPRTITAIDSNYHHLAVTALKVAAAQHMRSYDELYQLFGHGVHAAPEEVLRPLLKRLPPSQQRYWSTRHGFFRKGFYGQGLLARLFSILRGEMRTTEAWMRSIMHASETARARELDVRMAPVLRSSVVAALARSPVLLVAQGINYVQKERNLAAERSHDFLDVVMSYLRRVATTDLEVNWFVWLAVVGHYNHENQNAIPPYLRRESHRASFGAPTSVRFHHDNIFRRLGGAGPGTWSHFMLCDAVDWMDERVQRRLFEECLRTGRDGGVVLCRTVEPVCPVERVGLAHRLRRIEPSSNLATAHDRTRLYRGVNFYRIVQ